MAAPLPCDNHPDQLAVILTTNLEAGETLTLCWPCTLEWAAMLIGMSAEIAAADPSGKDSVKEVADLEPETPAPDASPKFEPEPETTPAPLPKRRAKAAQETTAPSE